MAICSTCQGPIDTDDDPEAIIEDRFFCEFCRNQYGLNFAEFFAGENENERDDRLS